MNDTSKNRRPLKINFVDFSTLGRLEDDWSYKTVAKYYDIVQSDEPDYLFDGGFGHEHLDHRYDNCVKIVVIGENISPDFNLFDYAIAFDHLEYGDRYLRQPLYALYPEFEKFRQRAIPEDDFLLKRDFCSFVVSDARGDPLRVEFFNELSKYKKVASGGLVLNNVGGRVSDKADFCSKYKFNIAFENSSAPGYVTEKIMQALAVNSVPIYYGDPLVEQDFHPDCMVRLRDRTDVQRAIEEIIYLDTHDDAYLQKCHAATLIHSVEEHEKKTDDFLRQIFDQPIENARRLIQYGNQKKYRTRQYRLYKVDDLWRKPALKIYNGVRKLRRII